MECYKIIVDNSIVGVGLQYIYFEDRIGSSLVTNKDNCQYVYYKDKKYHDTWMHMPSNTEGIIQAKVEPISQEEFESLSLALEENNEIAIEEEVFEEEVIENELPNETLEFIRDSKIKYLSKETNKAITSGIDFEGKHYSYTTQDQLNLISIIQTGNESLNHLYHADGESVEYYAYDTIYRLNNKLILWKNLNITYYHDVEKYIETLSDISEISALEYGFELPDEFKSDIYKSLKEMFENA